MNWSSAHTMGLPSAATPFSRAIARQLTIPESAGRLASPHPRQSEGTVALLGTPSAATARTGGRRCRGARRWWLTVQRTDGRTTGRTRVVSNRAGMSSICNARDAAAPPHLNLKPAVAATLPGVRIPRPPPLWRQLFRILGRRDPPDKGPKSAQIRQCRPGEPSA